MARKVEKVNTTERENELVLLFGKIDESKKPFVLALIHDFVEIEARCKALEGVPTFEIDAKNPKRQRKLPAHDMLKEWQQRKTEVTRALLRELDGGEGEKTGDLTKLLQQFETR